jgi:hypothetical protein
MRPEATSAYGLKLLVYEALRYLIAERPEAYSSGCARVQHLHTSAYVSIRQHTSAYVSIRQHTSAYVSIRQHTSAYKGFSVAHLNARQTVDYTHAASFNS